MTQPANSLHDSHVKAWHERRHAQARTFLARLDPEAEHFTFKMFDDDTLRKARELARIVHADLANGARPQTRRIERPRRWRVRHDQRDRRQGAADTQRAARARGLRRPVHRSARARTRCRARAAHRLRILAGPISRLLALRRVARPINSSACNGRSRGSLAAIPACMTCRACCACPASTIARASRFCPALSRASGLTGRPMRSPQSSARWRLNSTPPSLTRRPARTATAARLRLATTATGTCSHWRAAWPGAARGTRCARPLRPRMLRAAIRRYPTPILTT